MVNQEISITRSHSTMKPRVTDASLAWFECAESGRVYLGVGDRTPSSVSDNWRSPVNELPYRVFESSPSSSESGFQRIETKKDSELNLLNYQILGGFNNNAMEVYWNTNEESGELLWVALKTFTGYQLKYVTVGKKQPLIFAFADEDAYAYCDYSPCKECVFRCKHGFVLYAFFTKIGIVEKLCDRMHKDYVSQ